MLTSLSAHILPKLTVFTELITVFPSLDTFKLSMGPTVFLVIRVPRVQTNLATEGSKELQGVRQTDSTKCNTEIMALNHFPIMHSVP